MQFQLFYLFIEVSLYVVSELLLKLLPFRGGRTELFSNANFLMAQCCFLLLIIFILYIIHYNAYVLISIALFIFIRALRLKYESANSRIPCSNRVVVSKPLEVGSKKKERWKYSTTEKFQLKLNDPCHTQVSGIARSSPYNGNSVKGQVKKISDSNQTWYLEEDNGQRNSIHKDGGYTILSSYLTIPHPSPHYSSQGATHNNATLLSGSSLEGETSTGSYSTTPLGLLNSGNTCFVNSILQCLAWTPGFFDILSNLSSNISEEFIFLENLKHTIGLCRSFSNDNAAINTDKLLLSMSQLPQHLVVSASSAQYQHQQDVAEFLLWLLNQLHHADPIQSKCSSFEVTSSMERQKQEQDMVDFKKVCEKVVEEVGSKDMQQLENAMCNLSEIDWQLHWLDCSSALNKLFMGQILEARECQNCNKLTVSSEYFTLLPLPLKNESNLAECISLFNQVEELVQDNMITCSCLLEEHLTNATRLSLLSVLPKCLIIQLTRFLYDNSRHLAIKNNTPIGILSELQIFPYTMKAKFNSNCLNQESILYILHAVCLHSGSQRTSCGHYVSYCRISDNHWYYFDDHTVVPIENIKNELNTDFVLQNAYVLFYHRVD